MLARRLSSLAFVLLLPGIGAAAACGSSSNPASPDAGGASSDSGSLADVSVQQDTGVVVADAGPNDAAPVEAASDGSCPPPPTGPFTEAPHAPLPTVTYWGGPILTAPAIVTFTFPTTNNVAALQSFGETITQSAWFADVTKDYCIPDGGPCITAGPPGLDVAMTVSADATYVDLSGTGTVTGGTDMQAFVTAQVAAAVAASTIPAPGPSSLYVFYFPPTSTIWLGPASTGQQSCRAFSGYHNDATYTDGTTKIHYAILPDCSPNSARDLTSIEVAASHEIAEATTDPEVGSNVLSWYLDQAMGGHGGITTTEYQDDPWINMLFGEVADNCESIPLDRWTIDAGGDSSTTVQRIWSISAAAAGHNPCVPVPVGETYYNASPDKAIYVANVGDTFTVDLSAFSDVSRPAWALEAFDDTPTQMTMSGSTTTPLQYLQVEFVNGTTTSNGTAELACVNNGSTAQLKVTLLADPANDSTLGSAANQEWPEAVGLIYSVDHANPQTRTGRDGGIVTTYPYQFWPFAVVTPTTASANGIPSTGVADVRQLAAIRADHGHAGPRRIAAPVQSRLPAAP